MLGSGLFGLVDCRQCIRIRRGFYTSYAGRDEDLGRDAASKFLLGDYRENADMTRRFLEEAKVGGQLQYPGIACVHEVGLFSGK